MPRTHKLITIKDIMLALYRVHGSTYGFTVQVRGNGAVWVYTETDCDGRAKQPPSVTDSVLTKVRDLLGAQHGCYPQICVEERVDGVLRDPTRLPRIEIHPSVVGGVL